MRSGTPAGTSGTAKRPASRSQRGVPARVRIQTARLVGAAVEAARDGRRLVAPAPTPRRRPKAQAAVRGRAADRPQGRPGARRRGPGRGRARQGRLRGRALGHHRASAVRHERASRWGMLGSKRAGQAADTLLACGVAIPDKDEVDGSSPSDPTMASAQVSRPGLSCVGTVLPAACHIRARCILIGCPLTHCGLNKNKRAQCVREHALPCSAGSSGKPSCSDTC